MHEPDLDPREHADQLRDQLIVRAERALKTELDDALAQAGPHTARLPHALMLRLFHTLDPVQYAVMRAEYVETTLTVTRWPDGTADAVIRDLSARIGMQRHPLAELQSARQRALDRLQNETSPLAREVRDLLTLHT